MEVEHQGEGEGVQEVYRVPCRGGAGGGWRQEAYIVSEREDTSLVVRSFSLVVTAPGPQSGDQAGGQKVTKLGQEAGSLWGQEAGRSVNQEIKRRGGQTVRRLGGQ